MGWYVLIFKPFFFRHAEVMKKIIETVAEGGGELGVHMYPFLPRSCSSFSCETVPLGCYYLRCLRVFLCVALL